MKSVLNIYDVVVVDLKEKCVVSSQKVVSESSEKVTESLYDNVYSDEEYFVVSIKLYDCIDLTKTKRSGFNA